MAVKPKAEDIINWEHLVKLEQSFAESDKEWVFRGEATPKYDLSSTLERAWKDFCPKRDVPVANLEQAILSDFQRSCHIYKPEVVPDDDDTIGWFALMRHYGSPCRFLDFTFSFFIACYFAAEREGADPIIWAINKTWLSEKLEAVFDGEPNGTQLRQSWYSRTDSSAFNSLILNRNPKLDLVVPLNTFRTNDRLLVQQGLFLCPTDLTSSFEELLLNMPDSADNVRRFHIPTAEVRSEILGRLYRTGVNQAALFPGLQGFAESLRTKLVTYIYLQRLRDKRGRVGPATTGV
jgi:hypothetical protein